jgi:mRNA interferase YafQ
MERIAEGVSLDPRHRDHPLKGDWQGCRDCHVRGDLVLIYSLPPGLAVFHRVGSHSELFRR